MHHRGWAFAIVTTLLITAGGATAAAQTAAPATRQNPRVVAVVQGPRQRLELLNARTGKLVRRLVGAVGELSISPDGRYIYAQRTNGHLDPFPIDRIPANGGRVTQIASGEQLAVSPDGTRLAYEAGNHTGLVIQTLATGRRRHIGLASLIGPDASFGNTPNTLVWLSNHQLLAIPPADGTLTSTAIASLAGQRGTARTCSALYHEDRQCAIVVDLHARHVAHLVVLNLPKDFSLVAAGAGPTAGQLLLGSLVRNGSAITRFTVTDTRATRASTVNMGNVTLIVGFSTSGHNVLYLRGHGPIQLWTGRIHTRSVSPATELLRRADLGGVSW